MLDKLEWLLKIICAALAGALTIVIFLQVFYRFVLRAPLVWSEEMALFLFQWTVFMGAALAVKQRSHFGLVEIVGVLPRFILHSFVVVLVRAWHE